MAARIGNCPATLMSAPKSCDTITGLGVQHVMLSCPRGMSVAGMLEAYTFVAQEVRPRLELN